MNRKTKQIMGLVFFVVLFLVSKFWLGGDKEQTATSANNEVSRSTIAEGDESWTKKASKDVETSEVISSEEKSDNTNTEQKTATTVYTTTDTVQNQVELDDTGDIIEGQYYYSKEDVSKYLYLFGKLPDNYITKSEAKDIGWSTDDPDLVIGGDKFGNREGKLPKAKGRTYYEADIRAGYTEHRGPQRIVFSNDGLIFFTEDHYNSFEQLY